METGSDYEMAFYLRKSIKVGPVRFNISKSGFGVSAGIKGLRYGVRPGGKSYVHAGRYGIYYRKQLGSSRRSPADTAPIHGPDLLAEPVPTETYDSAQAATFADSNHAQLVQILNRSYTALRLDYGVAAIGGLLTLVCFISRPPLTGLLAGLLAGSVFLFTAYWESRRRTVRIEYDLGGTCLDGYKEVVAGVNELSNCAMLWAMVDSRNIDTNFERKRSAGASSLVNRQLAAAGQGKPPWVETNVATPMLKSRGMTLYFLPDGIFIYDASGVGHLGFDDLHLEVGISRFIEDSNVPHDAHVVDHTWQYTNKDGSPDRRFADNRQIPVCAYGQVRITSSAGLQIFLQTSREHAAQAFGANIKHGSDIMLQAPKSSDSSDDRLLVFVEKDEWESAGKMAAKMGQDIGGKVAAVFHRTNRAIAGVFGEENTIVYRFLQILFYGTASAVLLVVAFYFTRFLIQVL